MLTQPKVIGLLKHSYRNVIVLGNKVRLTKPTVIGLLEGSKRKKIKPAVIASGITVKLEQHRLIVLVEGCYRNKPALTAPGNTVGLAQRTVKGLL
jgi:hypothetical protein